MLLSKFSSRGIALLLAATLGGLPQMMQAWQQPTPPGGETQTTPRTRNEAQPATPASNGSSAAGQTSPADQGTTPQTRTAPGQSGTTVDPSQGPLEPAPTEAAPEALPSAETPAGEAAQQQQQPAKDETVVDQLPDKPTPQKPSEPVGAATAERGRTAGGAASKPAGTAIAPAKQRQVRSFLIKLGAIAGAGIAVGTIYMLTRGTSSTPPGATVR